MMNTKDNKEWLAEAVAHLKVTFWKVEAEHPNLVERFERDFKKLIGQYQKDMDLIKATSQARDEAVDHTYFAAGP